MEESPAGSTRRRTASGEGGFQLLVGALPRLGAEAVLAAGARQEGEDEQHQGADQRDGGDEQPPGAAVGVVQPSEAERQVGDQVGEGGEQRARAEKRGLAAVEGHVGDAGDEPQDQAPQEEQPILRARRPALEIPVVLVRSEHRPRPGCAKCRRPHDQPWSVKTPLGDRVKSRALAGPRVFGAYPPMPAPFVKQLKTRHGPMLALPQDRYITRALEVYGEFSPDEGRVLAQMIKPGMTVVEVGANIGAHTVAMARACRPGTLYAFEPQRRIFQILCANLVLNEIDNVVALPEACGMEAGEGTIPPLDYGAADNFGGV